MYGAFGFCAISVVARKGVCQRERDGVEVVVASGTSASEVIRSDELQACHRKGL